MITLADLQPFCLTGNSRPYLNRPFNSAGHTYATNGHIMVRVPAIHGVSGCDYASMDELVVKAFRDNQMPAIAQMKLMSIIPIASDKDCDECEGSGLEHDCPNCACRCDSCSGTKKAPDRWPGVKIDGACFDGECVAMMQRFGAVTIGPSEKNGPLSFYFDGGEGLLMGLKFCESYLEAELEALDGR